MGQRQVKTRRQQWGEWVWFRHEVLLEQNFIDSVQCQCSKLELPNQLHKEPILDLSLRTLTLLVAVINIFQSFWYLQDEQAQQRLCKLG